MPYGYADVQGLTVGFRIVAVYGGGKDYEFVNEISSSKEFEEAVQACAYERICRITILTEEASSFPVTHPLMLKLYRQIN